MSSRHPWHREGALKSRSRRGFTILEILMVIGLMGLLATVLAVAASRAVIDRVESPEEIFWLAVGEARKFALLHETEVKLSFDNENQCYRVVTQGEDRKIFLPTEEVVQLDFFGVNQDRQTVLIGGNLQETNRLERIQFFGDGTCTAFRVRLAVADRPAMVLEIDPWTCAPILPPREESF